MRRGDSIVLRGRASRVPAAFLFVSTLVFAALDQGRWGTEAALAAGSLALYYPLLRSALFRSRREIRLESGGFVLASGRGSVGVAWSGVGRVVAGLPCEMGLEVLDPAALAFEGRFDAPELPRVEDGFLWIRGRFEVPLPDAAELALHCQEEARRA